MHISYSEMMDWNKCPYYHKLVRVDKIDGFLGNEYTAFGTAIHDACEKALLNENKVDHAKIFNETFLKELKGLKEIGVPLKKKMVNEMRTQGTKIAPLAIPALNKYFGKFEIVSAEEKLYEPIEDFSLKEYKFKGFIDVVIKTPDGKYHIIDWKTCSWGWDSKKKTDRLVGYQLTLYKHFFSKKHNIDADNIETHFALLKRTAKKNNVEIFRVTSGKKKTENALNLMHKSLYNIVKKNYIKNRLSCTRGFGCNFYKTEHGW